MTFLDKTFCASPHCINECGRKMTDDQKALLEKVNKKLKDDRIRLGIPLSPGEYVPVSYGYFCDIKTMRNESPTKYQQD